MSVILTTSDRRLYYITVLKDGPFAYWRLGEPSGNMVSSGSADYDMVPSGVFTQGASRLVSDPDPDLDKAFSVAGTGLAAANGSAGVMTLPEFTIEAWIKPTNVTAAQNIYSENAFDGVEGGFKIDFLGSYKIFWNVKNGGVGGTFYFVEGPPVLLNTTYHLVGTMDQVNGMIFYVNGAQVGTDPNKLVKTTPTVSVKIGTDELNVQPYSGTIDEVANYTRALTLPEIQEHYIVGTQ